jgi:hypothetical protein
MYSSSFRDLPSPSGSLSQLSQLTIQIHTAALDLNGYDLFFGSENAAYAVEGAEAMLGILQNLLRGPQPEVVLGCRETRHDFRNKLAVVKGFSDLMRMDLPPSHPAGIVLDRLSERCLTFSALLDRFRPGHGEPQVLAS